MFAYASKVGLEGILSMRVGSRCRERDEPQLAEVLNPAFQRMT